MINNLIKSAKDLLEVAKAINTFKSETVQLKVLDIIFNENKDSPSFIKQNKVTSKKRTLKKAKEIIEKVQSKVPLKNKKRKKNSFPGPTEVLNNLISEGFLNKRKTIGDIVKQGATSFKVPYKSNIYSGILPSLIKRGVLKREKNSKSGIFEYFNVK